MSAVSKEWLVRTRSGEILGPFTQKELFEELKKRSFALEDEIAQSRGVWMSAQSLANHETEEFTLTHTRNQTVTHSLVSQSNAAPLIELDEGDTQSLQLPEPKPDNETPQNVVRLPYAEPRSRTAFITPLALVTALITILWLLVSKNSPHLMRPVPEKPTSFQTPTANDSPIVKKVYSLIQTGQSQSALKELMTYHEKHPSQDDVDYLIPYAMLLITEGDAPLRAKKLLEQVLASPSATSLVKARAQHWLGYMQLSENQGDMGEAHFLEALQLNPNDPATRFNLGRTYLKQKKYEQALSYLQLAEPAIPDLYLIHIYKGRAKAALGNMDDARQSFKRAIESSPDRWISYLYYSVFLNALKEGGSAQLMMKRMLTRDPHYEVNSPTPLGFYEEKIPYEDYLEMFEEIMGHTNGEEREMGKLYIQYLMAGPSSQEAKRIELVSQKSQNLLAQVLGLKVALDRDAPADQLREAMERLPQNLKSFGYYAYVLRADAKTRLGQFQEAEQEIKTALSIEPHAASAHWTYAVLLRKMQRNSDANERLERLLTLHPDYIPALIANQNY